MHSRAGVLIALCCTVAAAFQDAQNDRTFRVSVNLVQVDAVVTDSKGRYVTDLGADDFEVTEDGKPQRITNFSFNAVRRPEAQAGATIRKEDVRRSIVLMVDDTGPGAEEHVLPVMAAAHKFVAGQMAPGDLVAVTTSRGGMGFYQQFTSDKALLNAAIDHLAQRPGFGRWTIAPPVLLGENGEEVQVKMAPGEPSYSARTEPPNPIGHLLWAIQGLRNTPGRKAVVLFSHAFSAPASLVDLANRSGVVIYVIDPHGTDLAMINRRTEHGVELQVTGQMATGVAPYRVLARQTGGLFLLSAPTALSADLGKVLDDMSGYYLIGYSSPRSDPDDRKHHEVQVKVHRKGLTVRARNGWMGAADVTAEAPRTTHEYLAQALASPFNPGKVHLRMDATSASARPDPKSTQRQPVLRALLKADGRDLSFRDGGDGTKQLAYSVLIAVFRQDGTPAAAREQTFHLALSPEQAARVVESGLHTSMVVKLDRPGAYQVRAAVRDENGAAMGSAYSFLNVPDYNQQRIALSSISLADQSTHAVDDAGWAEYPAGSSVGFQCDVFGFRTAGKPAREPRIEMEVRLFSEDGNAPVFDSKLMPVPQATLTENFVAGRLGIGSDFAPGDYTLQLLVYDRLAGADRQVATQWTALTVVKPR